MAEEEKKDEEIKDEKKEETGNGQESKDTKEANDLSSLVTEVIAELPEEMQGLIPDSLSDVEKIKLARGLIKTTVKNVAPPEDGPGSTTPGAKKATDYSGMSSMELLNAGLK